MEIVTSGLFREIVDKICESVFIVDSAGEFVFANRAACVLTGRAWEELKGKHLLDEFDMDLGCLEHGDAISVLIDKSESAPIPLWAKATGKVCKAKLLPMDESAEQSEFFCLIAQDVSDKAMRDKRLAYSISPEVAVLLMSDFVHDMKNIILGVSGYAAMAMETIPEDHPVYQDLKDIASSMEELGSMIEQYSRVGRKVVSHRKEEWISEIISRVSYRLRYIASPALQLNVKFSTEQDILVSINREGFEDALMKVLLNSYESMNGSGRIDIDVASCSAEEAFLPSVNWEVHNRYCCIIIRDTGKGIDIADADRAFEPFFTTRAGTKHVGLGLTAAQSILRSMDGWIKIKPLDRGGTEVTIFIPQRN